MATDNDTLAHITNDQWARMEKMLTEVRDALLGSLREPGGALGRIELIERRLNELESSANNQAAGWNQAAWVVLSVVLSTATVGIINAVVGK